MSNNSTVAVQFENISRFFGETKAADDLSFSVREGEFFSMLGPSGSGKTTCLRLIAGFEIPDSGKLYIHNREMSTVPPYDRDVNTVFQSYALFPHMNVEENISYCLMLKKINKKERLIKAEEMLELVQLPGLGNRKPSELSGGQRQRVALARALINHPSVLLLDEPLGALDLKLREKMQIELKDLQRKIGITFIYVTHDQQEALSMSDRIAVFNNGKIEQLGTAKEIYETPRTLFVADFVGSSNVILGKLSEKIFNKNASFTIRPERIRVLAPNENTLSNLEICIYGEVADIQYQGAHLKYMILIEGQYEIIVQQQNVSPGTKHLFQPNIGQEVKLVWNRTDSNEII
ncbi:MAG: ABC transporter ATP-binding protein [Deltaproteobacteria bacterium]|jgi:putative spermidine/putrescine transport system ATP-binding protein|nr:ABC transporter ATP-binding protein [Deltaproteobacteria bacterium]MBT4660586.1 ABC transporter ATP-binding protein [Candidatus Neomarinimicrobiota bacterium]MBT5833936.1 ABC transporter ATP-binding protein [Deltaproteobacteria bacterium]